VTLLQSLLIGAGAGIGIGIAIGAIRAARARRSTLDDEPR
jgi:hypothetical protein